ncbi:MAG: hypothetical protein IPH65_17610 [Dehalococcoidia bacterium]|nr:hypothetical protein [Dehalococcoidia bacterium]
MYPKLAGMTGTAETEAEEFSKITTWTWWSSRRPPDGPRGPPVMRPHQRAREVQCGRWRNRGDAHRRPACPGRYHLHREVRISCWPVSTKGIAHEVLNAKQHEREAHIIADAGKNAAVTIATNMAGRGTDIKASAGNRGVFWRASCHRHRTP